MPAGKRRALGQHFLRDPGIARAIVDLVAPTARDLVVEIGPGEFYPLPTNHIVEGVKAGDRKVFVGWFGPVEIPFALRRIGQNWRVEAEPYFLLMNR